MIAEDQLPSTMTGETMYAYLVDQFTRLRDGDRFYFENALNAELAAEIKVTRLSDVIERNMQLDVQDEVFWTRDTLVFKLSKDDLTSIASIMGTSMLRPWIKKCHEPTALKIYWKSKTISSGTVGNKKLCAWVETWWNEN
jgi:hypothetical protein